MIDSEFYHKILMQSDNGFATHKVIYGEDGEPLDFEFIEANPQFEYFTGIKVASIAGKRGSEVIGNIKNGDYNWKKEFNDLLKNGAIKTIEQYNPVTKKWFSMEAHCQDKDYFAVVLKDITERKLLDSELNNFFNINLDLLCIASKNGDFVKVNRQWEEVLGYKVEEIIGKNFTDFIHPDDLDGTNKILSKLGEGKKTLRFVNRYQRSCGDYKYLEWRSDLYGENIFAAARDVSQHIELQQNLEKQKFYFESLVASLPDIIFVFDSMGNFVDYHSGNDADLLRSPEVFLGKNVSDILPENVAEGLLDKIQKIESGSQLEYLNYSLTIGGAEKHFQAKLSPLGENRYVCLARNMTQQVAIELNLKESNKFQHYLLENVAAGIIIIDPQTRIIEQVNQYAAEMIGASVEQISGKVCHRFVCPAMENNCPICDLHQEVDNSPRMLLKKDGSELPVLKTVKKIEIKGKTRLLESFVDISVQKRIEKKLARNDVLLKKLSEQVPGVFYQYQFFPDGKHCFPFVSEKSYDIMGVDRTKLKEDAKHFGQVIDEQDQQFVMEKIVESHHNNTLWDVEFIINHPRKGYRWMHGIAQPQKLKDGSSLWHGFITDITERKEIEDRLAVNEQNFRNFFETMDDLIFIAGPSGNIHHANIAVEKKLQYSYQELRNMTFLDLHKSDDREEAEGIFAKMFAREIDTCPLPLMRKDGKLIPVETKIWFGHWDDKEVIFGISKDLSKQQAALQKFNRLFDNNPALMSVSNIEKNTFDEVNSALLEKLEYTREEIIGKTPADINLFLEPERQKEIAQEYAKGGRMRNAQLKIRSKSGKVYDGLFSGEVIENQGELSFLTVMVDITEQKAAEKELEKLSFIQKILTNIASGYINMNLDDAQNAISSSLKEIAEVLNADRGYIYKYDFDKKTAKREYMWQENHISTDDKDVLENAGMFQWVDNHMHGKALLINDLSGADQIRADKYPIIPETKSTIAVPMISNDICIGFIGFDAVDTHHYFSDMEKDFIYVFTQIVVNLENRIVLEKNILHEKEKANAANKAKSEFLANMSHEIRTPMNSILGFSEIMLNTTKDSKQKNFLKTIMGSGRTLMSLINDILDLSKIEAGKMEISPEPVDLGAIVSEMKQLFSQKLADKNLKMHIEIDQKLPKFVIIDEVRIRQILLNLVGNAIKFTHQGYVKVSALAHKQSTDSVDLDLVITDTGIGIDPRQHERIFESFGQQSSQDNKLYGGTGLGLTITRKLCQLMGGEILLESEIGKGSRFTVRFKEIKSGINSNASDQTYLWMADDFVFNEERILVVDDVNSNIELINAYLDKYDLNVVSCHSGEKAVELAKQILPDLILMDIRMPGISGYEATHKIKKQKQCERTPVIALTASTMRDERNQVKVTFDGYLRKPIQKNLLLEEMVKHLQPKIKPKEENSPHHKDKANEILQSFPPVRSEVKEEFRNTFFAIMTEQSDFMILDDLQALHADFDTFAQKYDLPQLRQFNEDFLSHIDNFDLNKIQQSLQSIKNIFD